jgi:hypothetical protein
VRLERQVVIDAPLGHAWRALLGSGSAEPRRGTLTLADVPYRGTLRLLDRDDDDHVVSFQARAA